MELWLNSVNKKCTVRAMHSLIYERFDLVSNSTMYRCLLLRRTLNFIATYRPNSETIFSLLSIFAECTLWLNWSRLCQWRHAQTVLRIRKVFFTLTAWGGIRVACVYIHLLQWVCGSKWTWSGEESVCECLEKDLLLLVLNLTPVLLAPILIYTSDSRTDPNFDV